MQAASPAEGAQEFGRWEGGLLVGLRGADGYTDGYAECVKHLDVLITAICAQRLADGGGIRVPQHQAGLLIRP